VFKIGEKFGVYEILSAIGAGGMGEIYHARDTRLKRDVAIKVLPAKLIKNDSAVERFMREAYAASALNHPNILTIFDIGITDGINYIATELVAGQTLRTHIKHGTLSLTKALDIAVQVAGALRAAHEANIVHRDIKPENIMIRHDGYVKVLDFGLAKLTERKRFKHDAELAGVFEPKTNPGMILGTANYMSPEQARGLEVDTRSDIFSLGIVIYEMLSGQAPFSGETVSDVIAAILQTEPKPLREFGRHIPLELDLCITKALCKPCRDRYQTVREFLEDLKRLKQRLEFESELKRAKDSGELPEISGLEPEIDRSEQETVIFENNSFYATKIIAENDRIESLAILPLVNGSNDANTEYLSDGITESIINCLSTVPNLRVIPRSTVFRYKGNLDNPQKIGEELGVCAVLAGRVLQFDESLVVKTELVDIKNESQIWGEQYRHQMKDIFTLQDEIAGDISETLRLKVTGEHSGKLVKRYTENIEAYHYYLKGRYFVTTKRTEEWIKKGIEFFQKAIDLDPNYALAYSGIAEAYGFLASSTGGWSPHKAYPKAKAAALKALELDETLGEAHCSLGFFLLLYDWNFPEAEKQFLRAIELSPNYPNAYDGYGFYLKAVGRHAEAIEQCRTVQKLDPLSPFSHISLGYGFYFAREYDQAIAECRKALEMDRSSTFAYRNLGLAFLQKKQYEKAIDALETAVELSGGGLAFEAYLGYAYGVAGKTEKAREGLENLQKIAEQQYVPSYNFAMIHFGLNELDETFEWFEKSFGERSGFMPFLKVEPLVDDLRVDPRFRDLIERIGLV
jgi:eukaryotic-like serine/threonine-protein kinase